MNSTNLRYSTLKVVFFLFFWGITPNLYAQTNYKVTYFIAELKLHGSIDNLDERGKRFTKQVIARSKDINYVLIANQNESYFERMDILKKGDDTPLEKIQSNMAQRFASFNEKTYANHKQDSIIFVRKLVGQDFIIKRDYINFNWIIKDDTKKIVGFDAKKAEGKYYNPVTNKELKVEAWFIPSIQLQSGPDIFMGLPGLIAEINIKGAVITVKKIEKNENFEIDKIDDSKAMSQQEYEDLIKDLTKKFIEE